jgi:hypothetical protein
VPQHRFLSQEEAFAVGQEFRRRHPLRVRLVRRALGVDLRSDAAMREFLTSRPCVAFRPGPPSGGTEPTERR